MLARSCALAQQLWWWPPTPCPSLTGCREPIYPSAEVSFEVGASPDALHQCGGRFKVPSELASGLMRPQVEPCSCFATQSS